MEPISLSFLEGITKEQIEILPHALERSEMQKNWLYDAILGNAILGILRQRKDRYRIYYEHPTKGERYDLILSIEVKESSPITIKVVTAYIQTVNRRVR